MENTQPRFNLDRDTHNDLVGYVEDMVEHWCDENMLSGELAWIIVETLAEAKIAQLRGEVR